MLLYKNNYTHIILAISILIISLPMGVNARGVSNEEDLISCLSNESLCVLDSDIINDSDSIEISIENDVTLDLNGKSIKNYNLVVKNSNFTINDSIGNGTISSTSEDTVYITESNMTINGGKISSSDTAIYLDRTTGTINDGEFTGEKFGCIIKRASRITINDGDFNGISSGTYDVGDGLLVESSSLTINNGNFTGEKYGFDSNGCGHLEIKNGNYVGESGGIWLSNSFTCSNTENYSLISGGHFEGKDGARIKGRNTNVIAGGTFVGSQVGISIECANSIQPTCIDSILLKGGNYVSLGNKSALVWPWSLSAAIFMNSDPENPVKITDILEEGYELSNDSVLETEDTQYGHYSYTESLNVSISNPNLINIDDEGNENKSNNVSESNDTVQEVKVANTAKNYSIIIIILSGLAIILGLIIILKVRKNKQ